MNTMLTLFSTVFFIMLCLLPFAGLAVIIYLIVKRIQQNDHHRNQHWNQFQNPFQSQNQYQNPPPRQQQPPPPPAYPPTEYRYKIRPFLTTKNEHEFYKQLLPAATAKNLTVFTKVRLADLIEPDERDWSRKSSAFNKIKAKHVDFVLCEKQYMRPVLVIELDDRSHQRPDRKERDIFVDSILHSVGLPVLRTINAVNISEKIDHVG